MKKITDYNKCKGCALCQNVCPTSAITMKEDNSGFLHPSIDEEKCINCSLCEKKCIVNKPIEMENGLTTEYYKCQSKDTNNIVGSSSGGIFGELVKAFVSTNQKPVIYGAVYGDTFYVKHIRVTNVDSTKPMHYSKYIQSDMSGVYSSVKNDLDSEHNVLFTGTPCQIYSLKKYLNKNYENLLTVDVLCFSVTSGKIIKDYIGAHTNEKVDQINFRYKGNIKGKPQFVAFSNNKIVIQESFYGTTSGIGFSFGTGLINRSSCERCEFQSKNRCSDITIGDYVDISSEGNNHSLVCVHSQKGKTIFSKLEVAFEQSDDFNISRLNNKTVYTVKRAKFFKTYEKNGMIVAQKYMKRSALNYYDILKRKMSKNG